MGKNKDKPMLLTFCSHRVVRCLFYLKYNKNMMLKWELWFLVQIGIYTPFESRDSWSVLKELNAYGCPEWVISLWLGFTDKASDSSWQHISTEYY